MIRKIDSLNISNHYLQTGSRNTKPAYWILVCPQVYIEENNLLRLYHCCTLGAGIRVKHFNIIGADFNGGKVQWIGLFFNKLFLSNAGVFWFLNHSFHETSIFTLFAPTYFCISSLIKHWCRLLE